MITLPVSLTSIRSADTPAKQAGGAGETSFGEILERQVEASPHAGPRGDRGRDDVLGTPPGPRLDGRHDTAIDGAHSHAVDHNQDRTPDAAGADAGARTDDTGIDTECDIDATEHPDGVEGSDDETADTTVRQAPPCATAVPVDGVGQSLPAPSGQASAEPALVAEVAAVSGTAVPAAGSVAAAVDPLTTAAAALPSPDAITGGAHAPTGTPGRSGTTAGDDLPVITGISVETMPATPAAPTHPGSTAPTPAVPGGTIPATFGASQASSPTGTGPAATADTDAAPGAPTHTAIGDAGWVAVPAVTADSTPAPAAPPNPTTSAQPAPSPTGDPAAAATAAATTTAAAAAAASAADDGAPATTRPREQASATARADAPTGPATGAGAAPATAPGASASTADAATADGLVSAPLRTSDIAAQAQRDAQIRRAEHLTRLGIDVTTDGLGAIRIEASNAGGGLQLNLGAERASTRHLLAEQVGVLRDELGTNVSVDIGRGNTGQQPAADRGDERRLPGAPLAPAAPALQPVGASVRRPALSHLVDADRGLDLHL